MTGPSKEPRTSRPYVRRREKIAITGYSSPAIKTALTTTAGRANCHSRILSTLPSERESHLRPHVPERRGAFALPSAILPSHKGVARGVPATVYTVGLSASIRLERVTPLGLLWTRKRTTRRHRAIAFGIPSLHHSQSRRGGGLEILVFPDNSCHFPPFRLAGRIPADSGGRRVGSEKAFQGSG